MYIYIDVQERASSLSAPLLFTSSGSARSASRPNASAKATNCGTIGQSFKVQGRGTSLALRGEINGSCEQLRNQVISTMVETNSEFVAKKNRNKI